MDGQGRHGVVFARSGDEPAVLLSARWGVHTERVGRTACFPNVHEPGELKQARATPLRDQLARAAGLPVTGAPDVPTILSAGAHTLFGEPVTL